MKKKIKIFLSLIIFRISIFFSLLFIGAWFNDIPNVLLRFGFLILGAIGLSGYEKYVLNIGREIEKHEK